MSEPNTNAQTFCALVAADKMIMGHESYTRKIIQIKQNQQRWISSLYHTEIVVSTRN